MTIRKIGNKRYDFQRANYSHLIPQCISYRVVEIRDFDNKEISISDTLPLKISAIVEMLKESRLHLERLEGFENN